jgi:hypothetical protein
MTHYSYELDEGYFASLKVLTQHLAAMSHGVHQWGIVTVPGICPSAEGRPRSYALIGYSNRCANVLYIYLLELRPRYLLLKV